MTETLQRLVFAGTPAFSATCLQALLEAGYPVSAVYTQPDRPAGRGKKLQAGPVKQLALEHGLPVHQPEHFRDDDARKTLAALKPDLMIVVAYGLLLPQTVLDIPRHGCINIHASLLPRWRGAAPIERALEAGDPLTGITVMRMEAGLDTGPMCLKQTTLIRPEDTGASLRQRLAVLGASSLIAALRLLEQDQLWPEPQTEASANYAHKLQRKEAEIDWQQPAAQLALRVRAFFDANTAFTTLGSDRLKIGFAEAETGQPQVPPGTVLSADGSGIRIACGEGVLRATQLQLPGARMLSARELLNGQAERFAPGTVLGPTLTEQAPA